MTFAHVLACGGCLLQTSIRLRVCPSPVHMRMCAASHTRSSWHRVCANRCVYVHIRVKKYRGCVRQYIYASASAKSGCMHDKQCLNHKRAVKYVRPHVQRCKGECRHKNETGRTTIMANVVQSIQERQIRYKVVLLQVRFIVA